MGTLDGFYTTWSKARETYGEGPPVTGERFDQSGKLDGLASQMDAAAPGGRWSGSASEAYGKANADHQQVIGRMAEVDRKFAAQVTNAANLVSTGRGQLTDLRSWFGDAASSLPPGQAGKTMEMQLTRAGLSQLTDIIKNTDGQMRTVAGNLDKIKGEYTALGMGQKFAPKEGPAGKDGLTDEEKKDEPKMGALPPEERARRDVEASLAGDKDAAARIDDVFTNISPEQNSGAKPLTPDQSAYLSQMQHQMKGMSVEDIKTAEGRLGDHGKIVGDSMQLMSNDDIDFPDADTGQVAPDDKKFENLPQSVQDAIKSPGLLGDQQVQDIAGIVKDGDSKFQTGTELDRELMRKADRMMDAPLWEHTSGAESDGKSAQYDAVLQDVFDSAGRDHQIVHDHLLGTHGDDGQDFMHDITHHEWGDDGKAAGELFEWTKNTNGPEGVLAASTAHAYADYLGTHSKELLAIDGNHQIGDMNPSLVQAFSQGLMPYQAEMVEAHPANDTAFDRLDDLGSNMEKTKGLFAVIDTQPDAAREFNTAAYAKAMDMQQSFAAMAGEHPDLRGSDNRIDDLQSSARLLGVIDGGMHQETMSNIQNGHMGQADALANAQQAYDFKKDLLKDVFSYAPGGDLLTNASANALAGPPPDAKDFKFDENNTVTDIGLGTNQQSLQHQLTQAQYTVASQFVHQGDPYIDPTFFNENGSLKAPTQISTEDWSVYDSQLSAAMAGRLEINNALGKFRDTLGSLGGLQ